MVTNGVIEGIKSWKLIVLLKVQSLAMTISFQAAINIVMIVSI